MRVKLVVLNGTGIMILRRDTGLRGEGSEGSKINISFQSQQHHHHYFLSFIHIPLHSHKSTSMTEQIPLDVAAWLSDLSSSPDASTNSPTQDTPSKTYSPTQDTTSKTSQKRKRIGKNHSSPTHQHTESCQPLTHTALTGLSLNIMNTPSPSIQKRGAKKLKLSEVC